MSRRFRFSENTHIEECVAMPSKQLLARMDRRRQRQGAPSLLSDNFSSIISTVAGMSTRLAVACPVQQTTAVASPVQQKKTVACPVQQRQRHQRPMVRWQPRTCALGKRVLHQNASKKQIRSFVVGSIEWSKHSLFRQSHGLVNHDGSWKLHPHINTISFPQMQPRQRDVLHILYLMLQKQGWTVSNYVKICFV